jgi:hypothetical protein
MNDEIDVLPKLLQEVKKEFELSYRESKIIRNAFATLEAKKATYKTANEFAIEIGEILSKALGASISADKLPNGKMYYNIAQRLLTDVLGRNHEIVSGYASDVQKNLNDKAKIGLKVQIPELNQDRIAGIVNRFASEDNFEDVMWLLGEPIVNFTQSIIDDSIRKNAEFHAKSGLSARIERRTAAKCCEWCQRLAGTYEYPSVPHDVYRRHQNCRCTVDYRTIDGKRQNVHTKHWSNNSRSSKIELRKELHRKAEIPERKGISDARFNQLTIDSRKKGAVIVKGGTWANNHLDEMGANASSLGNWLIFRDDVTISEVLEETYHFNQYLDKLYWDKDPELARILQEIEAKKYLIENRKKYRIPRVEDEESRQHLKYYQEELKKWKEGHDEDK